MKYALLASLLLTAVLQGAGLTFESALQEVHADLEAKTVVSDFKFTNNTSETLTIRDTDPGCSCLKVEVSGGKLTYAPGESGILRGTFEVGSFQGAVNKEILIWLKNDPDDKPSSAVTLRVHIPVIIALEPKTVRWDVGEKTTPKNIRVEMDYEKPIHIKSVSTSNTDFTAELITITEGKTYDVKVTPKNSESPGLSIIRIVTDVDVDRQKVQQGFAVVSTPVP